MKASRSWKVLSVPCGLLVGAITLLSLWVGAPAQDKPIKGDDEIRANVRELQLEQKDLVYRFNQCSEVINKGQADFNSINLKIQGEVAKAFARAKLSQDEYDLNLETFAFAKKPSKPTATESKQAPNKP